MNIEQLFQVQRDAEVLELIGRDDLENKLVELLQILSEGFNHAFACNAEDIICELIREYQLVGYKQGFIDAKELLVSK